MNAEPVPLGRTLITAKARRVLTEIDIEVALMRQGRGDCGIVDDHDREANERALQNGDRLLSIFRSEAGERFYVITEWTDRSHRSSPGVSLRVSHFFVFAGCASFASKSVRNATSPFRIPSKASRRSGDGCRRAAMASD